MVNRFLPPLLLAALLVYLLARSGIGSYLALAAAALALSYTIVAGGRLLSAAAGGRDHDPCAAFAMGLIATCFATYVVTATLPVTAGSAFTGVFLVVAIADAATARRHPIAPLDWHAAAGFAFCLVLTALWCREPAAAPEAVRTTGVLPVWSDYFIHGSFISQFGDIRALGRGSIFLADYPPSFYHFASYAAAAALARPLQAPGLPLALGAWLPLGFLAMLAGAYALGDRLSGRAGGLAALIGVAMLPDASNYGLRNGWFSFHFTLLAHPGGTYAVGAALLSLALLDRWSAERSRSALAASAALALATFFFRAHVFFLYFPAWVATAAICTAHRAKRRLTSWVLIAGLSFVALGANLLVMELGERGFWRFHGPALAKFLEIVHTGQEPTAYTGVYASLVSLDAPIFTLSAGIVLAIVAALGAFVVLLPAATLLAREARQLRPIDAACGYLAFCWLLLMLFAPEPWHGDATDLIHRPFVLLYAASVIWTFCLTLRALAAHSIATRRLWPALLAAMLLGLPLMIRGAEQMSRPKFAWAKHDDATQVPHGLVAAADYLRAHAPVGDVFAVHGLSGDYATFDVSTQLCALSGIPAYLSRPYLEMTKEPARKVEVLRRLAALKRIDESADYAHAIQALRTSRVQWYVVAGEPGPRWDPDRRQATFLADDVALYTSAGAAPERSLAGDRPSR